MKICFGFGFFGPQWTFYPTPKKDRNRFINKRVQQLHFINYKKELHLHHSYDSIIGKTRFSKCAECKPSNEHVLSNITVQHVKGKHNHTLLFLKRQITWTIYEFLILLFLFQNHGLTTILLFYL